MRINPPLKCFQFLEVIYFFLGPGGHKPAMFNVLWSQFKMVNDRKMTDGNQRFSFVHNPNHN